MKKIKLLLPILGYCEIEPQCDQCVYNMVFISKPGGIRVKCEICGHELTPKPITKDEK